VVFVPRFTYTNRLVNDLGSIEAARGVIDLLPLPPDASLRLRHDALQRSTRSSTQIEGNPLDAPAVRAAIAAGARAGSAAEQEVRNYWRGLDQVEEYAARGNPLTEPFIRQLHRIVIVRSAGRRGRASAYRTTECPVVDTVTRTIDYGPPGPRDVPALMEGLVAWGRSEQTAAIPAPVRAGIIAHRFLSIHPFDDGNGRTGRLLATAELWRSGYRMRGFLSFDEYFSADRARYYTGLQMGLSVNFYEGRHDPDHTPWLEYFVGTLGQAARALHERAAGLHRTAAPPAPPWEQLTRRQQQVLTRLLARAITGVPRASEVQAPEVQSWFGVSGNTAREWLGEWARSGFVVPVPGAAGVRVRRYRLAPRWTKLLEQAKREPRDSTSSGGREGLR
jgi:cell filamentation protein, protein adenylyltransferase